MKIRKIIEARRERAAERKIAAYLAQSRKRLQVMEWRGRLWLSVDGAPVVPTSLLTVPVEKALREAREAWAAAQEGGTP